MKASSIIQSGKPFLIYGTAWKKQETARLVSEAIHSGFRFIDTACQPKHYHEPGVGEGWYNAAHELGIAREDLFLQTKFTSIDGQDPRNVPYDVHATLEDQVRQSLHRSLENLHTSYIDSLVLHSPLDTLEETLDVWRVFETFVDAGQVKQLVRLWR
jgi:diketogulonate reductase-like aldo/keto reductase